MSQMLTLKQHAYDFIRQKLERGECDPGGRLSDDALAKEIGVSRSPVREAISQLASEGLVEHRPRCGAFVRVPDRQEIAELYEAREALEGFAAARVAEQIEPHQQQILDQHHDRLRELLVGQSATPSADVRTSLADAFLTMDLEFHAALLRIANNNKIIQLVRDFQILTRGFHQTNLALNTSRYHKTLEEHEQILEAIRARDPLAAKQAMESHLRSARLSVLRGYTSDACALQEATVGMQESSPQT